MIRRATGRQQHRRRQRQDGSIAIMAAMLIVVMVGFTAMVVDVGNLFRVHSELQNASDGAALAGAQALDGTAAGTLAAIAEAEEYVEFHYAEAGGIEAGEYQIDLGQWWFDDSAACDDPAEGAPCFETIDAAAANAIRVNAVRVRSNRTAAAGNPVEHFFAPAIGVTSSDVSKDATAVGGGPASVTCSFPMVVPECAVQDAATGESEPYCMLMSGVTGGANGDTMGWTTDFGGNGSCGGPEITDLITGACDVVDADGLCTSCDQPASVQQTIGTCNGNNFNRNHMCGAIKDLLLRNGAAAEPFSVIVPVLETPLSAEDCGDFNFARGGSTSGFAQVTIFGAQCNGDRDEDRVAVDDSPVDCESAPAGDVIMATYTALDPELGRTAGGASFGISASVRLVE